MSLIIRRALLSLRSSNIVNVPFIVKTSGTLNQYRLYHRYVAASIKVINARKKKLVLPEVKQNRSAYVEWNYKAEIYSFGKRLNEEFDQILLTQAFTQPSFIAQEELRQREVGVEEPDLHIKDNRDLVILGNEIIRKYVDAFVCVHLPLCPDDGIKAIKDYLLSIDELAKISSLLGTKDLILSSEYPPSKEASAQTIQAIVGALAKSQTNDNLNRAYNFVRDFICTELNQIDLNDLWQIENPFDVLKIVCAKNHIKSIEPRIVGECAKNTIFASCRIAIYDTETKKQLGIGGGETIDNAIDVASLDALSQFYGMHNLKPFNYQITTEELFAAMTNNKNRLNIAKN